MYKEISSVLLKWYTLYRRELPWRETGDPYLIWISEVILQQTRVVQGLEYYLRFVERFGDVKSLAAAREDEVLKYWQGLGYYSRARNLHKAAQEIVGRFEGRFPERWAEVRSLPGIGDYTAAAVCSIAYGLPYAVVDGNVYRVLSRLFAIDLPIDSTAGKKAFASLANELLDLQDPGLFNQAMMEFGALQCVPRAPSCSTCALNHKCLALSRGSVELLPVKSKKITVKSRYFHYLHLQYGAKIFLTQRVDRDIWQGLYQFPMIESTSPMSWEELQKTQEFQTLFGLSASGSPKVGRVTLFREVEMPPHLLTHRVIHARFYCVEVGCLSPQMEQFIQILPSQLEDYPLPRLIALFLEKINDEP